jgi:leader peptidase (prepilin peptidase) / N-methyltransferase
MTHILATIFAALAGLAFGSFLNVCVTRWPENESIVAPRSRCRACARTLRWWENIPLLSWLILRGRCRTCKAWISWRYPLVELSVGALWALAAWQFFDWSVLSALPESALLLELVRVLGKAVFFWFVIALAALDAENLWLPDFITWPGVVLGFVYSIIPLPVFGGTFVLFRWGTNIHVRAAVATFMSAAIAALLILLIRWTYKLVRHRDGIGLGDAKLMAMLAAWLGLEGAILAFAIGAVLGAIAAIVVLLKPSTRTTQEKWTGAKLPLGTFLCIGGIVSSLWGQPILAAYLHWAGL